MYLLNRKHGFTYFNPLVSDWNMSNIPVEANAKETSLYLLFVISATARGIASMIEVKSLSCNKPQGKLTLDKFG